MRSLKEKPIEYKGYEVISMNNKKIVAQIKNNLQFSRTNSEFGFKIHLMHEPPIKFVFNGYESMVNFIDQNPQNNE